MKWSRVVAVTVAVVGTNGGTQRSLDITATAVPGTDDLEEMATQIAAVFIDQRSEEHTSELQSQR